MQAEEKRASRQVSRPGAQQELKPLSAFVPMSIGYVETSMCLALYKSYWAEHGKALSSEAAPAEEILRPEAHSRRTYTRIQISAMQSQPLVKTKGCAEWWRTTSSR